MDSNCLTTRLIVIAHVIILKDLGVKSILVMAETLTFSKILPCTYNQIPIFCKKIFDE
jgi:hypothetical protein